MDENETIYAQFVIDKLENAGGCLKFQHITGHLSQLDDTVRRAVGTKPTELMRFLRKYDNLFVTEKNGMVSLKNSAANPKFSSNDIVESENAFPRYLENHDGIVIKVLPNFGFIASKNPKTTTYFTPACFENKKSLLTDLVEPGQKVCFNAKRGDTKFESKYQAIKVWIPEKVQNEVLHPGGFQKSRKTRDTGLFDGSTSEGPGKVQKLFDAFGFIIIDNDPKNTVYFTKQNVCNYDNIIDLRKIMNVGDEVQYKACRSSKKDSKSRWQANKVWLKAQKESKSGGLKEESKSGTRELKKNEYGKIFPNANGAVIKFGNKFEHLADADSCLFYMHGTKVKDVCWEFSDGDNVMLDVIKINSAPGWKALLSWVGQRPNIVLPVDLGDFSAFPHEEVEDIPETGSYTSKTSDTSVLSEVSQNSSGASKNAKSLSSKVQDSPSKHRYSRDNNKSDFRGTPTRSLSRSSRSSQLSHVNVNYCPKSNGSRSSERIFTNSNSHKVHSRFEKDSGFGSDQHMPREEKGLNNEKESKWSHGYNSMEAAGNVPTKYTTKDCNLKKSELVTKVYANWGDSPYPDEEDNESDPDVESSIVSEGYEGTSRFDKNASDNYKSSHSKDDSHEKHEEIHTNDEFSDSEIDYENTVNEIENENPRMDIKEEEQFQELAVVENGIESVLEETSKDDAASICKESQIQPHIKRFYDLPGKILKVYCRYAEIENELLIKSTSFFWTDLYCNGRPAPDHFDDLNEVLREGQTVRFNCIEIVDDSGSCWHKITMAWKGQKPRIQEMTPEEYISENSLVVSVSEDLNGYEVIDASHNTEQQKPVAPARKFLTLAVEDEEDLPHLITEPAETSDDSRPSKESYDNRPFKEPSDKQFKEPSDTNKSFKEPSDNNRPFKEPSDNKLFKEPSDNNKSLKEPSDKLFKEPSDNNKSLKEPSDNKLFKEPSDNNKSFKEPCDSNRPFKEPSDNRPSKEQSGYNRQELLSNSDDILQGSSSPVNLIQLTEAVGKMFLSYRHSETDVDVIASDVISFVLSRVGMKNIKTSAAVNSLCEKESQTETVTLVAGLDGSSVDHKVDFTETSAQTIITGEVIAQSIFTQ